MDFVRTFERQCGSQASVKRLRAHPAYHSFNNKWNLPVYFQIRSVIYSHHLHPSEIGFEHQFRWTELYLTAPSLETIILFLGKQFRAEMHKKYHDCQSSSLIDKRIKFYFLVISRLRMLTPRELDQAQLLPRCYAFIHHEETERAGHLAALPLHFPLSSLSSNSRPILHL